MLPIFLVDVVIIGRKIVKGEKFVAVSRRLPRLLREFVLFVSFRRSDVLYVFSLLSGTCRAAPVISACYHVFFVGVDA